jgi:hypothetical protein
MLRQIMDHIALGVSWSIEDLARELDTSPQLVTAMLEDLARRGFLKPVGAACSGACTSCTMSSGCVKGAFEQVWAVQQK